jgi:hypothetical protein
MVGIFQAYYLFGTVKATKDVAVAALRQTTATIAPESPIIVVQQIKLVGYPDAPILNPMKTRRLDNRSQTFAGPSLDL